MERTPRKFHLLCFATVALALVCSSGCGKPLLYHFKHYHRPFAAIAKSNQTYFHSQQTGRIIEKDPCGEYCEPGCYGFEPTTWTHWPAECPGSFPVQGDVLTEPIADYTEGEPTYDETSYDEPIIGTSVVSETKKATNDTSSKQPNSDNLPKPDPSEGVKKKTSLPDRSSDSTTDLPLDLESAVPSPSDGSAIRRTFPLPTQQRATARAVAPDVARQNRALTYLPPDTTSEHNDDRSEIPSVAASKLIGLRSQNSIDTARTRTAKSSVSVRNKLQAMRGRDKSPRTKQDTTERPRFTQPATSTNTAVILTTTDMPNRSERRTGAKPAKLRKAIKVVPVENREKQVSRAKAKKVQPLAKNSATKSLSASSVASKRGASAGKKTQETNPKPSTLNKTAKLAKAKKIVPLAPSSKPQQETVASKEPTIKPTKSTVSRQGKLTSREKPQAKPESSKLTQSTKSKAELKPASPKKNDLPSNKHGKPDLAKVEQVVSPAKKVVNATKVENSTKLSVPSRSSVKSDNAVVERLETAQPGNVSAKHAQVNAVKSENARSESASAKAAPSKTDNNGQLDKRVVSVAREKQTVRADRSNQNVKRNGRSNANELKSVASRPEPKRVMTMTVSSPNKSTLQFTKTPSRKPVRMSAVSSQKSSIKFR